MKKEINIIPHTWVDIESLDDKATNEQLLERVNILTDYINYLYKEQTGI